MIKSVIGILLAASSLAPAIASAQQGEMRGNVQVEAPRDGDQARRDAYRAQQQQQQRGPDQGPQRPPEQYRQDQYPQGQRPNEGPGAPGGQGGYAGRGNDGRGYDNRGPQQGGPGYQNNRGPQQGGPGYQNNRGGWDQGWHGDRRYDWNGYRAQNRRAFHLPPYRAPGGRYGYRHFAVGVALGYGFYGQNYWIGNPFAYHLPPAYGPYRWVRYYNDALLVDIRSGYVVDAAYGIFF